MDNRTIVITDIHGELGKFNSLLDNLQIRADDEFIFMGDYIDRGENSKGVIDRVIELGKTHKCIYLKGSHEYAFLHSLKGEEYYSINNKDENVLHKYTSNVNFKSSFISREEFANKLKQ